MVGKAEHGVDVAICSGAMGLVFGVDFTRKIRVDDGSDAEVAGR